MERLLYRVNLDAMRTGIQTTLQGITSGERLSRAIRINISAKGEAVYLGENATAVMYVTKNGASTPSVNACTIEDNTIEYTLLGTDVDTAGMVRMQLKVVTTTGVLITPVFALEIMASTINDTPATTTPTYTALESALQRATEVYNKRLTGIAFENYIFYAYYADGSTYSNDCFRVLLDTVIQAGENEEGRIQAELARVSAETSRVNAELSRANAEASRVSAEEARVSVEESRVSAEEARATAEESRESAEASRVSVEASRVSAEADRVTVEAGRVSAESSRVTAENSRETAEAKRESDTASAIATAQAEIADAIDDAEEATEKANQASALTNKLREDVQKLIDEGGVVTPTEKEQWNDAYAKRHEHSNKTVLDTVTEAVVSNTHSHDNKTVLDTVTESVVTNTHTHSNKSTLDNLTDAVIDNTHTHSNKSLLDGLSEASTTNLGLVKVDGTTITVDSDGTLHGVDQVVVDSALSTTSTNPAQNKVITSAINSVADDVDDLEKIVTTNLFKPTFGSDVVSSVQFTNNNDGTYTLNNTAGGNHNVVLGSVTLTKAGKYKLSCLAHGKGDAYFYAKLLNGSTLVADDFGDGAIFNVTSVPLTLSFVISIVGGKAFSNEVIKPMITSNLQATYTDFVAYTGSTGKLNSDVAETQNLSFDYVTSTNDLLSALANVFSKAPTGRTSSYRLDITGANSYYGIVCKPSASYGELICTAFTDANITKYFWQSGRFAYKTVFSGTTTSI